MKLALPVQGGYQVGEHNALFPGTSFPDSGPNAEFIAEHNALLVVDWLSHDTATQRLAAVAPVLDGGKVRIVQVVAIPAAELAETQRKEAIDAAITADSRIATLKAMTNAQLSSWWTGLTTAQRNDVLFLLAKVILRKVL